MWVDNFTAQRQTNLISDGELVIDLSGAISGNRQRIDFDRLALVEGLTYDLEVFYASRTGEPSDFTMRTNTKMFSTGSV